MELYTDAIRSARGPDDLVGEYAPPGNARLAAAPERCVLVMQQNLNSGHLAKCLRDLSISIGQRYPELIGAAWVDHVGNSHAEISKVGIPILAAAVEDLRKLREDDTGKLF
jgi:hypothetical protein